MVRLIVDVCLLRESDIFWYFKDPFWNYSNFFGQDWCFLLYLNNLRAKQVCFCIFREDPEIVGT